uniref:14_3_3 domain-containing protein n=1 Tax=Rodentolepis nana TaxID=102285 RepID=A0A0R3TI76_RODNA
LRYQSEVDTTNEEFKEKAREAYNEASSVASEVLSATNPVRLGLALNHSVFLYEIADDHKAACDMAHATLQEAVANLSETKKEGQPEVCIILQLLRDNLSIWSTDSVEDE